MCTHSRHLSECFVHKQALDLHTAVLEFDICCDCISSILLLLRQRLDSTYCVHEMFGRDWNEVESCPLSLRFLYSKWGDETCNAEQNDQQRKESGEEFYFLD